MSRLVMNDPSKHDLVDGYYLKLEDVKMACIAYEHNPRTGENWYLACGYSKRELIREFRESGTIQAISDARTRLEFLEFDIPHNLKSLMEDVVDPVIDICFERER